MKLVLFLVLMLPVSTVFSNAVDSNQESTGKSGINSRQEPEEIGRRLYERRAVYSQFLASDNENPDSLHDDPESLDKIVDGDLASHGEFPWQASVDIYADNKEYFCGATIINEFWLLSAAHCFNVWSSNIVVSVGNYHRRRQDQGEQTFAVQTIFKHERYTGHPRDFDYDIALIKIRPSANGQGIQFNEYARPISLPEYGTSLHEGTRCVVSGWGKTSNDAQSVEDVLRRVEIPLIRQQVCQNLYARHPVPYVPQHMFCAGYQHGGRGSCQGDSGGGVVCGNGGSNILYGIVSWGYECEQPGYPGVYTLVPAFTRWIQSTISDNSG